MANLNAALVQQFLHVSVTQGKAVIEPNGVLDDGHGETVAVGLGVGHGQSAYPDPVKATQPFDTVSTPPQRLNLPALRLRQHNRRVASPGIARSPWSVCTRSGPKVSSSGSSCRPLRPRWATTDAPASSRLLAVTAPMPRDAPVTNTTLPLSVVMPNSQAHPAGHPSVSYSRVSRRVTRSGSRPTPASARRTACASTPEVACTASSYVSTTANNRAANGMASPASAAG